MGTSVASRLKTIAPTSAFAAVKTRTGTASGGDRARAGSPTSATPPTNSAAISTGRNPIRSPTHAAERRDERPDEAAVPDDHADRRRRGPGRCPTISSTISAWYGRRIWLARNATP